MGMGEERTDRGRRSVGRKALGTRVTESGHSEGRAFTSGGPHCGWKSRVPDRTGGVVGVGGVG